MIYEDGIFGPTFVSVDLYYVNSSQVSCHVKQPPTLTHGMHEPLCMCTDSELAYMRTLPHTYKCTSAVSVTCVYITHLCIHTGS